MNKINDKTGDKLDDKQLEQMKTNFSYPEAQDQDIQYKLYKKREFYYNKVAERPNLQSYEDIKEYRDNICAKDFALHEYQTLLANLINPDTPLKGCIVFHGLGTGKCILPDSKIKIYFTKGYKYTEYDISVLWDLFSTKLTIDDSGGCWSKPSQDLFVDCHTGNGIERMQIKNLYREEIKSFVKKYILKNGDNITATFSHKFLVKRNNKLEWTNLINIGSLVAVYKYNELEFIPVSEIQILHHSDYVYDLEVEKYHNYVANNIVCHNTCAGVAVAEKFKPLVQKYNTKIYVLVPGPLIKESWKHHIVKCTGETYMKKLDKTSILDKAEVERMRRNAINQAMQYYKFMSYKSFHKKVLGEKIVEKKEGTKVAYKKTEEGEFERDVAVDKLYNLNNSIIIADEAHNLTGNEWGEALRTIISNSTNLKVLLMTATPMKNLADDIVELINFLRPVDFPMERDKIFSSDKNYEMTMKSGGIDYFQKMASGYISHVRGSDPMVFAKRVDRGEKPPGLLFTKVTRCKMLNFQQKVYDKTVFEAEDALDRASEAVSNFVFPILSPDKKELVGTAGNAGLTVLKNQLKSSHTELNKKISEYLFKNDKESDLIYLTSDNSTITGKILKMPYLKNFSTKFYKAVKKLNRLVYGKKGPKTGFIYSNLVKVGIDLFEQILIQNGYLLFEEDYNSYIINDDTRCYYCGKSYKSHQNMINIEDTKKEKQEKIIPEHDSASSTDYDEYKKHKTSDKVPQHTFYPATFVTVTGASGDEGGGDVIPEEKKRILDEVFNKIDNKEGKFIKFVLGSKVINEGVSLYNVGEVHILDVYYNFGRVDQVVGRGIRWCSHYQQMNENNVYPFVNVYKYVVSIPNGLSSEEELYQKAELKYLLIKKVERAMKEVAIDCPLNLNANIFDEEKKQFKDCEKDNSCPAVCDYTKCDFKCANTRINTEYYDPDRGIYRALKQKEIDLTTFTTSFARSEIDFCKKKIKEMYLLNYIYLLSDIISYVKSEYPEEKVDLFDDFFVYKALDELIPINQNELNSFKDTITDKNNRTGYLIFVDKYYIFQPYEQNEDVPIYYRTKYVKPITQSLSLYSYIKNLPSFTEYKNKMPEDLEDGDEVKEVQGYNFDITQEYYDNRDENKYVGIIDKDVSLKKSKTEEQGDLFKLREKRSKVLEKKRGTGIPSLKGAVCTTREKSYIDKVAKDLGIKIENDTRLDLCMKIKDKMLELEKYQTGDKKTYMMIPANHPLYPFPYNLEDRTQYIIKNLKEAIPIKIDISKKKTKDGYIITIDDDNKLKDYKEILDSYKAEKTKDGYVININ